MLGAVKGKENQGPGQGQRRAALLLVPWLVRAGARCFGFPGSPLHCGGSGRRGPAGVRAMDRAHSVACTRTCSQRNPGAGADPARRMRGGRNALGCISLLTFFVQALRRRSGANSGAGREAAKGRMPEVKKVSRSSTGRVEALAFWNQDQKQKRWIPAKNMRKRRATSGSQAQRQWVNSAPAPPACTR